MGPKVLLVDIKPLDWSLVGALITMLDFDFY